MDSPGIHDIDTHNNSLLFFRLYERAIKAAGTDFRSDKLWDSYISWEKDLPNVTSLHDRVLSIPTQLYRHHYDRLILLFILKKS